VSWEDAVEFCRRLSELPAEKEAGHVYRLPTEAEWEYACRAGTTTNFGFGDDDSNLDDYAWFRENSAEKTHPVGGKKPNAWGLYGMHGNVGEWCQDWKEDYPEDAVTDPTGPASGLYRVIRGGSYLKPAEYCRSASRSGYKPSSRNYHHGFRVSLSPSGK
jgi:formylglycine-generating enzyme required for sulfatase activity